MKIQEALQIVLDLGRDNALNVEDCIDDGNMDLVDEAEKQAEALSIVETFITTL